MGFTLWLARGSICHDVKRPRTVDDVKLQLGQLVNSVGSAAGRVAAAADVAQGLVIGVDSGVPAI